MSTPKAVKHASKVEAGGLKLVTSTDTDAERVVLFTIDDVEYTVPAKPSIGVTLRFQRMLKNTGNDMYGILELLECMLGEDGLQALLDYKDLTDDIMAKVIEACVDITVGKAPKN